MTLRNAEAADWEAVYGLVCDMERTALDREAFADIFQDLLSRPDHCFLLCEEQGHGIGCLHLRVEYQLHHAARVAEALELAVAADQRGQGIGKQLLDAACRLARERGCIQIEVCCNRLRTDAHRFYRREQMYNYHDKLSRRLDGETGENRLGR